MVDAIDVMGDADHVRATVRAYVDAGVDVPGAHAAAVGPRPRRRHRRHPLRRHRRLTPHPTAASAAPPSANVLWKWSLDDHFWG